MVLITPIKLLLTLLITLVLITLFIVIKLLFRVGCPWELCRQSSVNGRDFRGLETEARNLER